MSVGYGYANANEYLRAEGADIKHRLHNKFLKIGDLNLVFALSVHQLVDKNLLAPVALNLYDTGDHEHERYNWIGINLGNYYIQLGGK